MNISSSFASEHLNKTKHRQSHLQNQGSKIVVHRVMARSILSYSRKSVHELVGFILTLSLGEKFRILVLITDCYTLFVTANLYFSAENDYVQLFSFFS